MAWERLAGPALALVLSPLLLSVIVRVKARFAGRRGMPLLQPYFDLAKLFRKGVVYSRTSTAVFRLGPVVALAATIGALAFVPMLGLPAVVAFPGDFVLAAYLLGLGRFFTVIAALDTGSAFEGMGASREVHFSALAEPALFLALAALARSTNALSLSVIADGLAATPFPATALPIVLCSLTLFVVLLTENARIPIDDPTTHLELTMIHEVMVLDHSGPELGLIEYQSGLKMWIFAGLIASLAVPVRTGNAFVDAGIWLGAVAFLMVAVGTVESTLARLRLIHVPRLIVGAGVLSLTALVWS